MLWNRNKTSEQPKTALILSGGGARAAYQVGVLQAIADVMPKNCPNPFPILCGTSAGAINAAALAIFSEQFREAVWRLVHVWGNFHVEQVFRTDAIHLSGTAAHWFSALILGGLGKNNPIALLDRAPLHKLLSTAMPFDKLQSSIDKGYVHALSIAASSYSTGTSVAFYQGAEDIKPWSRPRHMGVPTTLRMDHLMASSAIPFVFKAEAIENEFYGDGSVRQTTPISPALHLGADKLLVIGVKHENDNAHKTDTQFTYPSLGQIGGHVLDSIFLDNVDLDLERVRRTNKAFSQIPDKHLPDDSRLMRPVDVMSISPSQDLYKIAGKHAHLLPRTLRFFLKGIGASQERGSNLISYILFEKNFCRELIHLGYGDTMERRQEILDFLEVDKTSQNSVAGKS